jgi:DNA-binding LacI/PurR family transcriptional regulator
MVSLRRLADLAGVSHVTVLRALRGERRMSDDTRQRILDLAELYNYEHHHQTSIQKKIGLIGMLVGDVSSPVYSRALKGALQEAFLHDYRVITLESHHNVQHSCKALEVLIDMQVEGVLLAPGHYHQIPSQYLYRLHSNMIHTVAFSPSSFKIFPIAVDNVINNTAKLFDIVIGHLMDLGHRDIAYLGPIKSFTGVPVYDYHVFLETIERRHLPQPCCFEIDDNSSSSVIENVIQQIISAPRQPTAAVAWSDSIALKFIQVFSLAGYQIPRDMSVTGSGNCWMTCNSIPALTTVEQHFDTMAQYAMKSLINRIMNNVSPSHNDIETTEIDPQLIIRNSCGRPRKNRLGS